MSSIIRGSDNFDSLASSGLGDGQTWQNVKASRVSGVTYTNTTGKSILVSASFSSSNSNMTIIGTVDAATPFYGSTAYSAGSQSRLSLLIPNGSSYSFVPSGGTPTIGSWLELR